MNDREGIELFHLIFLDWLGRKMDKACCVVKGGCNLRFFFHSVRYSQDLDLDAAGEPVHALREKVNGILQGRPFRQTLLAREIEIEHVTESKQTDTVQRWKLGLRISARERPLPTKIEFSRRGLDPGVLFENVDSAILAHYRLAPILSNHYNAAMAVRQKLEALRSRTAPQARDIFDLQLLTSAGADIGQVARQAKAPLSILQSRVLEITHAMFAGQVLAYLPPDEQARYADPRVWAAMVVRVAEALQEPTP